MVESVAQEFAFLVVDPGQAAGHPCSEVVAGCAQHDSEAAGHVLAAVIAHTFHDSQSTGVAHRKAFAGTPRGIQGAPGCAIEGHVAEQCVSSTLLGGASASA